jgi:hypothetical protein
MCEALHFSNCISPTAGRVDPPVGLSGRHKAPTENHRKSKRQLSDHQARRAEELPLTGQNRAAAVATAIAQQDDYCNHVPKG